MEHVIFITRSQLRQVIADYITASRLGETMSYAETARLSTDDAAESSTSRMWDALLAIDDHRVVEPAAAQERAMFYAFDRQGKLDLKPDLVCAEDLAAGQVVVVNSRGLIEGKRDEADSLVMDDKPIAQIEFGFFQAEQLLSFFGGDTDTKITVMISRDQNRAMRMHAYVSEHVEEGSIELIDSPDPQPDETPPDDNASLFG